MDTNQLMLQPGAQVVPGYTLVRVIGRGGFGEVWEARAPGDFPVALKFIQLDTSKARPEVRALELLRTVRHPHLLDVQWAVEKADRLIVAMPLCDQSLHGRFQECTAKKETGLPWLELLGYMMQIAEAIDFLNEPRHSDGHGRLFGVQHRDVKPHNIFLVGGAARLADFGLAKILDESGAHHSGSMTPAYAPPEFFRNRIAATSDQYSLAVTYCLLRGGRLPFTGTIHEVMHKILHEEPDLSHLPLNERSVVSRALAKDPDRRWPNCHEFVTRLTGAPMSPLAPRSRCLQMLGEDVRAKTLNIFDATKSQELMWVPPGTSNHILWNAGHALWAVDALCVQIMTGRSELPDGWEGLFGMGSRPKSVGHAWPARGEVRRQLVEQLPRVLALIGSATDADLDQLPRHPHGGDDRTLCQSILHGFHDEANHQGEMYLLLKSQRLQSTQMHKAGKP